MGGSQSKEEVIISQAGNSGGATAKMYGIGFSLMEIIGIVAAGFIVVAVIVYLWYTAKKSLKRTIRREIQRSQTDLV